MGVAVKPPPADTRPSIFGYTIASKVQGTPTMSSREIAELCDKEHRHVLRDIENLNATYGQMGMLKIEQTPYTHEPNLTTKHPHHVQP